ncbi:MAG: hypothetical protein MRERV_14c037 [Mycoplasmataceae bacterium RV_VA103A]|nr:MAG: hypothetical protein MRERV_14c037 [Mycoplasmataceae bacterium RV_VA103A]
MVNNINDKPLEMVQELKDEYKTPSYEEFMKGYGSDGNLNYDDLNEDYYSGIKKYGPMIRYSKICDSDKLSTRYLFSITILKLLLKTF